jgi:hypothetical protein
MRSQTLIFLRGIEHKSSEEGLGSHAAWRPSVLPPLGRQGSKGTCLPTIHFCGSERTLGGSFCCTGELLGSSALTCVAQPNSVGDEGTQGRGMGRWAKEGSCARSQGPIGAQRHRQRTARVDRHTYRFDKEPARALLGEREPAGALLGDGVELCAIGRAVMNPGSTPDSRASPIRAGCGQAGARHVRLVPPLARSATPAERTHRRRLLQAARGDGGQLPLVLAAREPDAR